MSVLCLSFVILLNLIGKSLSSEILSPSCHQSRNNANATFELKENGKEYIIASPGYPLSYPFAAMDCNWEFRLPDVQGVIELRCDAFEVGKVQNTGKCYGDALFIMSPHNETLSLCGKRDGLAIKLSGYQNKLILAFKSMDRSTGSGFACRLKMEQPNVAEDVMVETTADVNKGFKESPCECGIANEDYLDHENSAAEVVNSKNEVVDSKIINGYETKPNEYPWQVALVKSGHHTPFCGGSIISDKHVLTAAHCTADIDFVGDIEVLVGEHDLMTSADECTRVRISRIHEHQSYNAHTVAYDFSIIVLAEKLHFSRYVRPICLPVLSYSMSTNDFTGHSTTVSGWGLHTFTPILNGHGPYSQRLNKLQGLKVLSREDCQQRWNSRSDEYGYTSIVKAMLCAKKNNGTACFGDSGGPLMFKNSKNVHILVGVVSFGPQGCGDPTLPNVFARVTEVLGWIFSVMKPSAKTCLPTETDLKARLYYL